MDSPQPEGTAVSMDSVIEVQRRRIKELVEHNIMLEAALNDKERQIKAMLERQS